MAVFSDLPDETLERVLDFIVRDRQSLENVSLVNHRFIKIALPLFVRQWNNSQEFSEPSIGLFALHLLRHPHLRKQVRTLDLGYVRPFHEHDVDFPDIMPESLAALADAAEQDKVLPHDLLARLCHQIREGCEDAIAVLILAWSTNLTGLSITAPDFYLQYGENFMVLLYFKQAMCQLLETSGGNAHCLPLGQVRHIEFQYWNRVNSIGLSYAKVFFHLPNIETLTAHEAFDDMDEEIEGDRPPAIVDENYALPLPIGGSTVKELTITRAGFLKVHSNLDHGIVLGRKELAHAIMKQKGSMRELDLDIKFDYIVTSNVDPALAKTYQNLSRLQRLTTSISDLSEVVQSGEEEDDIKVVLGRIPLSIEVLKPRCCKFLTDWISHDLLTEPYLEGMQELLEEAGPRGRFSSLRVLDLSETFMDDHSF
ncbi:hypothetical protein DER45DRAFT_539024 [Fusarium avenaceum]|nr:hypothetical protein DER45DRAFT_539024 [Fusarium avenaceum]